MISRSIAKRIPDIVRSTKLMTEADPIMNVVGSPSDPMMQLLFAIWYEFIEPYATDEDLQCPVCRQRIMSRFKAIYSELIELETEYKLLQAMKKQ